MKKLFTLLFSIAATWSFGQINTDSPFPVDFEVLSPASVAGIYDYGTYVGWGPTLDHTVTGTLVWAFDETDSLACADIINTGAVAGHVALIRRGTCSFTVKARNAWAAGAVGVVICNHYTTATDGAATVYNMSTADTIGNPVDIPGVFLSRSSCETIVPAVDAGQTVEVSYTVKQFYNGISSYSYHTPLSQAIPVDAFRVNFVNIDSVPVSVTAAVQITSPSGSTESYTGTSDIAGKADSVILLNGAYTPTELGEYTAVFSNDQNDEVITTKFDITDYTWGLDNGNLDRSAGPTDDRFLNEYNLTYNIGSLVFAGPDGAVVTHASFGLANPQNLVSGDPTLDVVNVVLYNADADGDNQIDFAASGASFDDLTPVAIGSYSITAETPANELIPVELESLSGDVVTLEPGGAYYIAVLYDGSGPALGVGPRFLASQGVDYINYPTSPLFLDALYSGWDGLSVAVQLHLDGFVTDVKDVKPLNEMKVKVMPNPATDYVELRFDLDQTAGEVNVGILDMSGKPIGKQHLANVHNETYRFDVSNFPAGTYILSIQTPEGYRAEKFVVVK